MGVHFFGEENPEGIRDYRTGHQKTHHKIPDIVLLELHSGSCLSTLGDVAGTESRDFLDLGLPVELGFIPPAYGFMSRRGKPNEGVKKETRQQVPGKTGGAGNLNNPEGVPSMNILVSFIPYSCRDRRRNRRSILLSSFSKEELNDTKTAPDAGNEHSWSPSWSRDRLPAVRGIKGD